MSSAYEREIREYLVGRLGSERSSGTSRRERSSFDSARLLDWWIFEGKRYRGLTGPLACAWKPVERQTRRLLSTHNPHWRPLESPEGEVDWLATAFESATARQATYVCRTSQLGLSADEGAALLGWQGWISARWRGYSDSLGLPPGAPENLAWAPAKATPDLRQLKRWAFVSRKSRWPVLRSVVAETLRAVFEPQFVDRLPLPSDPATLFELVCLVRILRALEPTPSRIRWLDLVVGQNEIRVPGIRCSYQHSIPRDTMLRTSEFDGGLREGVIRHQVRLPARIDGLFQFEHTRAGFAGILLEAKSGSQDPDAAIFQLKCYRAALRENLPRPLIIWGIVEKQMEGAGQIVTRDDGTGDIWIFSSADRIGEIAGSLVGGVPDPALRSA